MFEHVRSRIGPIVIFLDFMTPISPRLRHRQRTRGVSEALLAVYAQRRRLSLRPIMNLHDQPCIRSPVTTELLARLSGTVVDLSLSVLRIETTLETPADVLLRLTGKIPRKTSRDARTVAL
jgi:hypothetical protein